MLFRKIILKRCTTEMETLTFLGCRILEIVPNCATLTKVTSSRNLN